MSFMASAGGAAAISGGIDALSGLFGASKDRDAIKGQQSFAREIHDSNWWHQHHQFNQQMDWARNQADYNVQREIQQRFNMADMNGIHRLAMLGVPGAGSYSMPSGSSTGPGQSDLPGFQGNPMLEGLGSYFKHKRQNEIDSQMRKESDARIEVDEARAQLLEAQSRTVASNLRSGGPGGTSGGEVDKILRNLYETFQTKDGSKRDILKGPDFGEMAGGAAVEVWDAYMDILEMVADATGRSENFKTPQNKKPPTFKIDVDKMIDNVAKMTGKTKKQARAMVDSYLGERPKPKKKGTGWGIRKE